MSFSRIPFFALLLVVLAACGNDSTTDAGSQESGELSGAYWSVSITENGEPRALVDGTQIQVSFTDGRISASTGCNTMGGSFSVSDSGVLQVSDMSATEMGCDGPRHEQDDFVSSFLTSSPVAESEGDSLMLSTDSVRVEFVDRETADPDQSLFDTQWTFDTFFDQSTARTVFIDEPGWLRFADESNATGFDGCVEFAIAAEVADGELQFGGRSDTTTATCNEDTIRYATLISNALRGDAIYEIAGPALTITAPNGEGIILRSDV